MAGKLLLSKKRNLKNVKRVRKKVHKSQNKTGKQEHQLEWSKVPVVVVPANKNGDLNHNHNMVMMI